MSKLFQEQQRQRKLDEANKQSPFDPEKQFYPADLFILVSFDSNAQPIWERNPRWHTPDGFYIGGSKS
jgi:hypothetical protein